MHVLSPPLMWWLRKPVLSQAQYFHYLHYFWSTLFCRLEQNGIGVSGATALADALTVNRSLKTLR